MAWRYMAQRVLTDEWLDWDLPLTDPQPEWALSGTGGLTATISPDMGTLHANDNRLLLEEWGTLIYAEDDGIIRWGGILVRSAFEGAAWKIECIGFAGYPHGIPYASEWRYSTVDPLNAVREIWRHVQSFPGGDLNVQLPSLQTPVRVGDGKAEPYELVWWESKDCGSEIESLAQETPFDFVERHEWNGQTVAHHIDIGYPRLGRKRDDLSFVQGENIDTVVTAVRNGDDYANEILGIGAGEGRATLRTIEAVRDEGLLRRVAVVADKSVTTKPRLITRTKGELAKRLDVLSISSITVVNHLNAEIGSWSLGDDIRVTAEIPWLGEVSLWCRVVGWKMLGESRAELSLVRSNIRDASATRVAPFSVPN